MMIDLGRIAFVILLIVASMSCEASWPADELRQKLKPTLDKCYAEGGMDEGTLASLRQANFESGVDKIKAYLLCIFKTLDVIDYQHHDFEYWKILGMVTPDMKTSVFEMGKGCLHIKGEDYAAASLDFIKCLHKANPEKFAFLF